MRDSGDSVSDLTSITGLQVHEEPASSAFDAWPDVLSAEDMGNRRQQFRGLRVALKEYYVNSDENANESGMLRLYNLVKHGDLEEENVVDQSGKPELFLAISLACSMLIFIPAGWMGDGETQTEMFSTYGLISKTIRSKSFRNTLHFVLGCCVPLMVNLFTNTFQKFFHSKPESSERHVNTISFRIMSIQIAFASIILVPYIIVLVLIDYPSSVISAELFILTAETWQLFALAVTTVTFLTQKFAVGRVSFFFASATSTVFLVASIFRSLSVPCSVHSSHCHQVDYSSKAFILAGSVLRLAAAVMYAYSLYHIFAFTPKHLQSTETNQPVGRWRCTAHEILLRNTNIGFCLMILWNFALVFSEGKISLDQVHLTEFQATWFLLGKAICAVLICCTPINLSSAYLDAVRTSLRAIIADQKQPETEG